MRFLRGIPLFVLSALATLLVFEVFLQAAEIQTPMETRIDPEYGPAYVEGIRVTRFNEGFYIGGVNRQGFYGPEVPREAGPGDRRVLLLGDSYVMGITVFDRDHFGRLLEQKLRRDLPGRTDVLNFGRADFNFWNMWQYYRDFAGRWDHDLVLFFVKGSDLVPGGQGIQELYPAPRLVGDTLTIDYGFRDTPAYASYRRFEPVINNSALFRLAFNAAKMVMRGELDEVLLGKFAGPSRRANRARNMVHTVKDQPLPPVTRAILAELEQDPRVVLVLQGGLPGGIRQELGDFDIPVWDLGSELQAQLDAGDNPYWWEVTGEVGHWNHATHRFVARFLEARVEPLLARDPS